MKPEELLKKQAEREFVGGANRETHTIADEIIRGMQSGKFLLATNEEKPGGWIISAEDNTVVFDINTQELFDLLDDAGMFGMDANPRLQGDTRETALFAADLFGKIINGAYDLGINENNDEVTVTDKRDNSTVVVTDKAHLKQLRNLYYAVVQSAEDISRNVRAKDDS